MPSYKDPVDGWTENLYGPQALLYGGARGVVRVVMVDTNAIISVVPVDFCSNLTLACAWKTGESSGKRGKGENPPIYAIAPSEKNPITYGTFIKSTHAHCDRIPVTQMLWYPFVISTSPLLFPLAALFLHTIPGYLIDTVLRLKGRKPLMVKLYQKIHKNIGILGPFSRKTFNFEMANTQGLLKAMSKKDRIMYDFDMVRLDWGDYFRRATNGIRVYLAKEPITEESVAKALKLHQR